MNAKPKDITDDLIDEAEAAQDRLIAGLKERVDYFQLLYMQTADDLDDLREKYDELARRHEDLLDVTGRRIAQDAAKVEVKQ